MGEGRQLRRGAQDWIGGLRGMRIRRDAAPTILSLRLWDKRGNFAGPDIVSLFFCSLIYYLCGKLFVLICLFLSELVYIDYEFREV